MQHRDLVPSHIAHVTNDLSGTRSKLEVRIFAKYRCDVYSAERSGITPPKHENAVGDFVLDRSENEFFGM